MSVIPRRPSRHAILHVIAFISRLASLMRSFFSIKYTPLVVTYPSGSMPLNASTAFA
jgi:hypothetical protein